MNDALDSLDEALSGEWPDEDRDELDQILVLAEGCEDKLAEIAAKAKETLADLGKLVSVSAKEE